MGLAPTTTAANTKKMATQQQTNPPCKKKSVLTYVVNHSLNLVTNIQLHGSQAHHIKALINNMNLLLRCGWVCMFLPTRKC